MDLSRTKRTVTFEVTVDLDMVPGAFHTKEDARDRVEAMLKNNIGHYNPTVTIKYPS